MKFNQRKSSLIGHSVNSNGFLASESSNFIIAIWNVMNEGLIGHLNYIQCSDYF
jgi:hypothetical protein